MAELHSINVRAGGLTNLSFLMAAGSGYLQQKNNNTSSPDSIDGLWAKYGNVY